MNNIRNLSRQILETQKAIHDFQLTRLKNVLDGEIVLLTNEPMIPDYIMEEPEYEEEHEEDYEGDMALTELASIADKSAQIYDMIQETDELPAWIQSKITLAAHNMTAVHDYIKYKRS